MDKGKLLSVWLIYGGFITQAPNGAITWFNPTTNAVSRRGQGVTHHIFCVLPQDSEVGGVPSAVMSVNLPQLRLDAGKFHVQKFSLEGRIAAGGEGAAVLLAIFAEFTCRRD